MKKKTIFWIFAAFILVPSICLGQAPRRLGGFTLGADIADCKHKVNMKTSMPTRYQEGLLNVEINHVEGFKSGTLCYGTCANPGRILRIKLKYANPSKQFYEQVLEKFKEKFGEPMEWRGDMFHVVEGWKWGFVDENKNKISLILQHNLQDKDENIGNTVKLTMTDRYMEEQECFRKKNPDYRKKSRKKQIGNKSNAPDWDILIPK